MNRTLLPAAILLAGLAGCDSHDHDRDGDGDPTPTTSVGGVAAIGVPIDGGAVDLQCGDGAHGTTSSAAGRWTLDVPTAALPCAVRVSGGTVGGVANATTFYSLARAATANVTPVTDLEFARAIQAAIGSSPEAWFEAATAAQLAQVAAQVDAALAALLAALADAGYTVPAGTFDPITFAIDPTQATDAYDSLLEAYGQALHDAALSYADARASFAGGGSLPDAPGTGPVTADLPVDKLGVAFTDSAAGHVWIQPAARGGITAIDGDGDGQVIVRMGDTTDGGPDGTVQFVNLPNKVGTFACGSAQGSSILKMQVTFNGITNPRMTFESSADGSTEIPGYECSVTLTHVGAFESRFIYGTDVIEGTFTAKLRQLSPVCAGEGNCSPYTELQVTRGAFRINKLGTFAP